MEKAAKISGFQLKLEESPKLVLEEKNLPTKRHKDERADRIVKPFTPSTSTDDATGDATDATNTKSDAKLRDAPSDIKTSTQNTKLLLKKAQERIKKLKEERQLRLIDAPPAGSSSNPNEPALSKQDEVVSAKDLVRGQKERENNPLQKMGEEIKQWQGQFQVKSDRKSDPVVDSTLSRPIDSVPSFVRPLVPPIRAVMGRPPLASWNIEEDFDEARANNDRRVVLPRPGSNFDEIITPPSVLRASKF